MNNFFSNFTSKVESTTINTPNQTLANPEIINDSEGYFPFFEKEQVQGYLEFFKKYGVVVIRVVDKNQCQKTVDDLWNEIKKEKSSISRDDPLTWDKMPGNRYFGMFPDEPSFFKSAIDNRQNLDIYEVFKNIYGGEEKLWVSFDRMGILRPTKDILVPSTGEKINKPEWQTSPEWLHWDMNPWIYVKHQKTGVNEVKELTTDFISENNDNYDQPERVQGLLTLDDAPVANGGFCTVIGFRNRLEKWTEDNKGWAAKFAKSHFVQVPKNDSMFNEIRHIGVRAGCLIIWHCTQPHSNFPNNGSGFRYCQYLKMFPVPRNISLKTLKSMQQEIIDYMPKGIQLTQLGQKLYRYTPW